MRQDRLDFNRRTSNVVTTFYCSTHGRVTRERFAEEAACQRCEQCKSAFAPYLRRFIT